MSDSRQQSYNKIQNKFQCIEISLNLNKLQQISVDEISMCLHDIEVLFSVF